MPISISRKILYINLYIALELSKNIKVVKIILSRRRKVADWFIARYLGLV